MSKNPLGTKDQRKTAASIAKDILRELLTKNPSEPVSRREVSNILAKRIGAEPDEAQRVVFTANWQRAGLIKLKSRGLFVKGPEFDAPEAKPAKAKAARKTAKVAAKAAKGKRGAKPTKAQRAIPAGTAAAKAAAKAGIPTGA